MFTGIMAGVTWALETVVLGIALSALQSVSAKEALLLAPFISTFIHDMTSAIYMFLFNCIKNGVKEISGIFKNKSFKWIVIASAIGGPVGMTGYVLTVNYMGASIGAVASAIYPAVGSILAYLFLKEKIKWYQWIFLVLALLGVFGLSYSPGINIDNFWLGLCGVVMCSMGWGMEGVILSKYLKDSSIKNEIILFVRQLISASVYALIILPMVSGWKYAIKLFETKNATILLIIAVAALCATISYLFYYKAIAKLGVSKAMGLNITYTAWAIFFGVAIFNDVSSLNSLTVMCAVVVVVCGIFAATDFSSLFGYNKIKNKK